MRDSGVSFASWTASRRSAFSIKIRSVPFHHDFADVRVEDQMLDGTQERQDEFESVHLQPTFRELLKVRFVYVVEIRFQIAEGRR
jgi:hypothetical protein